MSRLPAAVRLALWATAALAAGGRAGSALEEAVRRAGPGDGVVVGGLPTLQAWRDLGERVVLPVSAHAPRHGGLIARGGAALQEAVAAAEWVVLVPGVGGALVALPRHGGGFPVDEEAVEWVALDADPVPPYLVEALDVREARLRLVTALDDVTRSVGAARPNPALAALGPALDEPDPSPFPLPPNVPPRVVRLLEQAAAVADATTVILAEADAGDAGDAATVAAVRHLDGAAAATLATSAAIACLHVAGLRPGRDG